MKKKKLIQIICLIVVIIFSIVEIAFFSIDLANYTKAMEKSKTSLIVGIILFSVIALVALSTIIYMFYLEKKKELYRLKK